MSISTIISEKTGAEVQTFTISEGSVAMFVGHGLTGDEEIVIDFETETGYEPYYYLNDKEEPTLARMTSSISSVKLSGSFHGRVRKPVTEKLSGVSRYT